MFDAEICATSASADANRRAAMETQVRAFAAGRAKAEGVSLAQGETELRAQIDDTTDEVKMQGGDLRRLREDLLNANMTAEVFAHGKMTTMSEDKVGLDLRAAQARLAEMNTVLAIDSDHATRFHAELARAARMDGDDVGRLRQKSSNYVGFDAIKQAENVLKDLEPAGVHSIATVPGGAGRAWRILE